jgi:antirestriction protein ArdC
MTDIYESVTSRIVAALERGQPPWVKPWKANAPGILFGFDCNARSRKPYNGINTLLLWFERAERGYTETRWCTFQQALELGGHVRKGQKGTGIVFWKIREVDDTRPGKDGKRKKMPLAKSYTVFNVEQCDGLDATITAPPEPPGPIAQRLQHAEMFCKAAGATVHHGGSVACYVPSRDEIALPMRKAFKSEDDYIATYLHELVHWTAHPTRLDRNFKGERFGSEAYAFEELVAEIGAAFGSAHLQLPHEHLQHEAYLAHWLKILKGDNRAIFTASSKARQAHEYLVAFSEPVVESEVA